MRRSMIPMKKVQQVFSHAVLRRDCRCVVRGYEPCGGSLECSHFFTQGSSPALMFYPANARARCRRHHWEHHCKKDGFYRRWLEMNDPKEFEWMERARSRFIRYTDDLKSRIIELCEDDRLDLVAELVRKELGE